MSSEIYEGVFAINKPSGISSAQVIRDVQQHFSPSALFRPWLDREHTRRESESHNQKVKRKWRGKRGNEVKMGHGGTLDPMATGVLILGVGQGTKELGYFTTGCTKSYEAVVLFGAATDTYDTEGKVLKRAETSHITKESVEEQLAKFKGKGVQRPPVFSALKVQGKKLYEYAREGKEVPVEIKERPVDASELEMVEWFEGGSHEWHWPTTEASEEERAFAETLLSKTEKGKRESEDRKREREEDASEELQPWKRVKAEDGVAEDGNVAKVEPASTDKSATPRSPCPAPACRIRMTVTSGFYVRSLCHDLGAAVGSLACMSNLVRTSQGGFELGSNVLWYDELKQGEDVWGPKVKAMLVGNQKRGDAKTNENDGKAQKHDSQSTTRKEPDVEDLIPLTVKEAEVSEDVHPKEDNVTIKVALEEDDDAVRTPPPAKSKWRAGY